jgi:uncharacterized DUF497 family protein
MKLSLSGTREREWDPRKASRNLSKHGILFDEARSESVNEALRSILNAAQRACHKTGS